MNEKTGSTIFFRADCKLSAEDNYRAQVQRFHKYRYSDTFIPKINYTTKIVQADDRCHRQNNKK